MTKISFIFKKSYQLLGNCNHIRLNNELFCTPKDCQREDGV